MIDLLSSIPDVLAHAPVPLEQAPKPNELLPIKDCAEIAAQQGQAAGKQCAAAAPKPETLAATEVVAYVLADLALILVAARIVGGIFVRLRQPRVVGRSSPAS